MAISKITSDAIDATGFNLDSDTLTIDSSGNVGVGTSSPEEALHVYHPTANINAVIESGDANAYLAFKDNSTTGYAHVFLGASGNNMTFFSGGSSERMRLDSSGHLILKKNLVLESTSEGIDFSGVGSSAQTLDDYEEGTWTPTIATGTINAGSARYTKIGNLVHVTCEVTTFSNRTSTNNVTIGGLPFSCVSDSFAVSTTLHRYVNTAIGGDSVLVYQGPSATTLIPHTCKGNDNYDSVQHNNLSSTSTQFYISHTYRT